jgi:hypothetical protein
MKVTNGAISLDVEMGNKFTLTDSKGNEYTITDLDNQLAISPKVYTGVRLMRENNITDERYYDGILLRNPNNQF